MFRATCAHRQEVKILLYDLWYHHTAISEWSKITKITKITKIYKYKHIVAKLCMRLKIQFWPPDDEHMVLETCRGMK